MLCHDDDDGSFVMSYVLSMEVDCGHVGYSCTSGFLVLFLIYAVEVAGSSIVGISGVDCEVAASIAVVEDDGDVQRNKIAVYRKVDVSGAGFVESGSFVGSPLAEASMV